MGMVLSLHRRGFVLRRQGSLLASESLYLRLVGGLPTAIRSFGIGDCLGMFGFCVDLRRSLGVSGGFGVGQPLFAPLVRRRRWRALAPATLSAVCRCLFHLLLFRLRRAPPAKPRVAVGLLIPVVSSPKFVGVPARQFCAPPGMVYETPLLAPSCAPLCGCLPSRSTSVWRVASDGRRLSSSPPAPSDCDLFNKQNDHSAWMDAIYLISSMT
ncbi:hypothetical protein Taro_052671 [Colocasia esculenta]|uniref:Uncharacterized protein n=1 Tax=Colocasia esculenta TaxID=4460 RepID=A0A843XKS9_COLES|nr:hypothetical protein [Colocasia esculenta]